MIKLSSSLLFTLVLSLQLAFGQSGERETVTQALQWFSINSNIKMTKRLSWVVEGQFRYADDFDQQQYQARTALAQRLAVALRDATRAAFEMGGTAQQVALGTPATGVLALSGDQLMVAQALHADLVRRVSDDFRTKAAHPMCFVFAGTGGTG